MASRVVHIRLPEEAIVACYDMYEVTGKSHTNLPMSTVITSGLIAAVNMLRRDKIIPTYDYAGLQMRLAELTPGREDSPPIAARLTVEDFEEISAPIPMPILNPAEAPKEVEVEPPVEAAPLNLEDLELLTADEMIAAAPKDRLVELCQEHDMPDMWAALGVVYKALPQAMWGGPKAEELFMKTLADLREAGSSKTA